MSEKLRALLLSILVGLSVMTNRCAVKADEIPLDSHLFDRKAFLALLDHTPPPTIKELKLFYQIPRNLPPRRQDIGDESKLRNLGHQLFFEPLLSRSGKMSCATCHNPRLDWLDGLPQSTEGNGRRSMSLYNIGWDSRYTWSGRAGTIMQQVRLALTAAQGMASSDQTITTNIANSLDYQGQFRKALKGDIPDYQAVHMDTVALALEEYVRSIRSSVSPFDRWIAEDPTLSATEFSEEAASGFLLFNTKANCARCHNSWRFSDSELYDTGLAAPSGRDRPNVPLPPPAVGKFKSVGLRNIARRPPYMHDGSLKTLNDILDFYDRGGDVDRPTKSEFIRSLHLSAKEKRSLITFLEALSDDPRARDSETLRR